MSAAPTEPAVIPLERLTLDGLMPAARLAANGGGGNRDDRIGAICRYITAARRLNQTDAHSAGLLGISPGWLAAQLSVARRDGHPDAPPPRKRYTNPKTGVVTLPGVSTPAPEPETDTPAPDPEPEQPVADYVDPDPTDLDDIAPPPDIPATLLTNIHTELTGIRAKINSQRPAEIAISPLGVLGEALRALDVDLTDTQLRQAFLVIADAGWAVTISGKI